MSFIYQGTNFPSYHSALTSVVGSYFESCSDEETLEFLASHSDEGIIEEMDDDDWSFPTDADVSGVPFNSVELDDAVMSGADPSSAQKIAAAEDFRQEFMARLEDGDLDI